ncbi:biliverdin-producing heme oxygenase [Phaeobacter sp. B1627]|uniref:biliverdin-producing heme oxygenase n=1 Tax=Phaeobacter sp. B1627 TaxID=2583809 RepID=UPI00111A7A54|nr:biliverdin-producing heme oxygenase [Phaeobacter sp. B1627]TNJ48425.1 biliverdin-producing heme oxygenase [Phaeobacter sp. B1627]
MNTHENLRLMLRHGLRTAHDALDASVSRFDLTEIDGMIAFLRVQEAALARLPMSQASGPTAAAIADLTERARADLQQRGVSCLQIESPDLSRLHPLAVDYVIGGSRLGAEVLQRRWASGRAAELGVGGQYMSAPRYIDIWRDFCASAADISGGTPLARRICGDASDLFALFETAADRSFEERQEYV